MTSVNRRTALKASAATAIAAAALPNWSMAQTASYGPEDLKGTTLTPFGSIRAGNADGTIPAWTGEATATQAGYQPGDTPLVFTDEKPLYSISNAKLAQYQDKLAAGAVAMFKKFPDYRMDVYPTHRTSIAPQYVYDNIYKNASRAQLISNGQATANAYGGIPFPFPKNGNEVIWNHELSFKGVTLFCVSDAHTVTSSGQVVFESRVNVWFQYPYYFENGESSFSGFYIQQFITPIAPPYEAGGSIVNIGPVNPVITPVEAWTYLKGERRVRRAPELQYDTPNSLAGGTTNWDEANIFSGKQDRYDFKYVGLKEMIVPYNCNKFQAASIADQYGPKFMNPDLVRWELHRVRVVEATVKPGARNVDARRTIYCDEDGGSAIMCDIYDASGSLWKFLYNMPIIYPNIPCVNAVQNDVTYDLHAGDYTCGNTLNAECHPQWKPVAQQPASFFTPGQLAASAGGF